MVIVKINSEDLPIVLEKENRIWGEIRNMGDETRTGEGVICCNPVQF